MAQALNSNMQNALTVFRETGSLKGVHHQTVKALKKREVIKQLDDGGYALVTNVAEQIGDARQYNIRYRDMTIIPTHDWGQTDYRFWDRARRCKIQGLELAGLFLRPLESKKAAWVMGKPPKLKVDSEQGREKLNEWWRDHHSRIQRTFQESVGLGDCYMVINADLSVTIIPPDVVDPIVDDADFSKKLGYRITEVYPHPTRIGDTQTIIDEYTAEKRVRIVRQNGIDVKRTTFPNLIKRNPMVKISNNRGSNEEYGHPEGEAILEALHSYGDTFAYAHSGNKRQGRPTPVISEMGDVAQIEAFWNRFGTTRTQTLPDGTTQTYIELNLDADNVLTLGGTAKFAYVAPGSFTKDTEVLLGLLFYLILQHTEYPEFIWGNAIASSKASADSQMEPFSKWVEKQQGDCNDWVIETAEIVLAYLSLYEPGVRANEQVVVQWPSITGDDGRLTLEAIKICMQFQLLDDETALSLMPLDIENPREVLDKLKAQLEEERQAALDQQEEAISRLAAQDDQADGDENPDDEGGDTEEEPDAEMTINRPRWMTYESVISEQHTGVMVAFALPTRAAILLRRAAIESGLKDADVMPAEDMHVTLAFLGDIKEQGRDRQSLVQTLEGFVATQIPIIGTVSGIGRFTKVPVGAKQVIYASFDAPDLPAFRDALVEHLDANGFTVNREHGFTPHITLAYVGRDVPTPNIEPDINLNFDALELAWGDERTRFRLGAEMALRMFMPERSMVVS